MTAVYTTSAFALSVQIPRINDDCLIGGVPAHDLAGIDIEASKERFDALILAIVQAEYPGAEFGDDFRVCDQYGNADTVAAREAFDWIANEAENLFNGGTFWVEETYPPIGGGSQELDTQYNGWTNYATWRVQVEILDDYTETWIDGVLLDRSGTVDRSSLDRRTIAKHLAEVVDDALTNDGSITDGIALDYARSFISEVNYNEIARHYLDALAERIEYGQQS